MAAELENSIRSAAEKVVAYIGNVSTMTVETRYVKVGLNGDVDFTAAKPIARTVVSLDGDSETVLPVRVSEAGVVSVDTDLLNLHQRNVSTAIDYRARLLDAMIGMLKTFVK